MDSILFGMRHSTWGSTASLTGQDRLHGKVKKHPDKESCLGSGVILQRKDHSQRLRRSISVPSSAHDFGN